MVSGEKNGWSSVGWGAQITNNQGDLVRQKKMLAGKSLKGPKQALNSPQAALHMLPGGHHWEALKEDTGLPIQALAKPGDPLREAANCNRGKMLSVLSLKEFSRGK